MPLRPAGDRAGLGVPGLDLDPVGAAPARLVEGIGALGDHPLQSQLGDRGEEALAVLLDVVGEEHRPGGPDQLPERLLADAQLGGGQVATVEREQVEGDEGGRMAVGGPRRIAAAPEVDPRLEPLEVGMSGLVEDHDLAVQDGAPGPELGGDGGGLRIAVGLVPAAPAHHPDLRPVDGDDGPDAVVLQLVDPAGTGEGPVGGNRQHRGGERDPRAAARGRGVAGPGGGDGVRRRREAVRRRRGARRGGRGATRRRRNAFGRASLLARVPTPGRGDLGQGATALDGAILSGGVVPGDRRLVPLLDEQEVALRVRAGIGVMAASADPDQDKLAAQLLPGQPELDVPRLDLGVRVGGGLPGPLEGAGVPELHRAHPVPGGDHALEVAVVDRVVLGLDGQPAGGGVQGGAAGDRPGEEDAPVLEPEVVVEAGRPVHLDAEAAPLREPVPEPSVGAIVRSPEAPGLAARLGSAGEVALPPVFVEGHGFKCPGTALP